MKTAVKREELLEVVKRYTEELSLEAIDILERVARVGKDIKVEPVKLNGETFDRVRVTFGSNLYTVVEPKAVEIINQVETHKVSDNYNSSVFLPLQQKEEEEHNVNQIK